MTDAELIALAKAATPGRWEIHEATRCIISEAPGRRYICDYDNEPQAKSNCEYIAAFNPETTLSLFARLADRDAKIAAALDRLNSTGGGTTAWVDTLHDVHAILLGGKL